MGETKSFSSDSKYTAAARGHNITKKWEIDDSDDFQPPLLKPPLFVLNSRFNW